MMIIIVVSFVKEGLFVLCLGDIENDENSFVTLLPNLMTHAASLYSMGMFFLWFGNLPMLRS